MSAQDNLSGAQWHQPELTFPVHRGLTRKPTKGKELGMHWSADPHIAREFAGRFGSVIHGEVPMSAVETDTHTLRRARVFDRASEKDHPEYEVPVKSGASVKVTKIEGPVADPKTGTWNGLRAAGTERPARKRSYKNSREMTA